MESMESQTNLPQHMWVLTRKKIKKKGKLLLLTILFFPSIIFASSNTYWCGTPVQGLTNSSTYSAIIDHETNNLKVFSIYISTVELKLAEEEYTMTISEGRRHIKHSSAENNFYLNCEEQAMNPNL